jgi:hypothetical protein
MRIYRNLWHSETEEEEMNAEMLNNAGIKTKVEGLCFFQRELEAFYMGCGLSKYGSLWRSSRPLDKYVR